MNSLGTYGFLKVNIFVLGIYDVIKDIRYKKTHTHTHTHTHTQELEREYIIQTQRD